MTSPKASRKLERGYSMESQTPEPQGVHSVYHAETLVHLLWKVRSLLDRDLALLALQPQHLLQLYNIYLFWRCSYKLKLLTEKIINSNPN